jgi:hypothetical protein
MFKLFTAPTTNERGPRYMERAFAAIHQTHRLRQPLALHYTAAGGQVAMVLEFDAADEDLITSPVTAHYPECSLTVLDALDPVPKGWKTWTAFARLTPDLFPILRHAQFEDALNRTYADPITGILRAVTPSEDILARLSVCVRRAPEWVVPTFRSRINVEEYRRDELARFLAAWFAREVRVEEPSAVYADFLAGSIEVEWEMLADELLTESWSEGS